MNSEINTIRTKDGRNNKIIWLIVLFLLLIVLTIGLLSYLSRPMLVVDKPNIKLAAVGITIQDVETDSPIKIEPVPEKTEEVEELVYEEPEKQDVQVRVPRIVAPVISTTEKPKPVTPPEQVAEPLVATSSTSVAVNTYTLSYIASNGGYLVGSTTQVVIHGGIGTEVTAVPNKGYGFYSWSDGSVVSTRVDTALTSNSNFTANFVLIPIRRGRSVSLSNIATVTSGTYTVSAGGTANETITAVPFGTDKATFLAALTKGQADQSWNNAGINDPVASTDTLVVTAQDGTTVVTYTVTVDEDPPPPPPGGPG